MSDFIQGFDKRFQFHSKLVHVATLDFYAAGMSQAHFYSLCFN